MNEDLVTG